MPFDLVRVYNVGSRLGISNTDASGESVQAPVALASGLVSQDGKCSQDEVCKYVEFHSGVLLLLLLLLLL